MIINKKTILLTLHIFLINFIAVFSMNVSVSNTMIFLSFLPLYFSLKSISKQELKKILNSKISVAWLLFSIIVLLSELQNGNLSNSFFLLLFPLVIFSLRISMSEFVTATIVGLTPIVLVAFGYSLLGNKFSSNTIGIIVAAYSVISIIYFIKEEKMSKTSLFIFMVTQIVSIFTLLKINSRTSLLIVFMAIALSILHLIIKNFKRIKQKVLSSKFKVLIYILITGLVVLLLVFGVKMLGVIFTPKWRPGDISTGRFEIWGTTIEHTNLFGHPYNWYTESGLFGTHKGPHNIFIGLLAFTGIVGLLFFMNFLVTYLVNLFKEYKKSDYNVEIAIYGILLATSITKGLTESMVLEPFYQIFNYFLIFSLASFVMKVEKIDKLKQPIHLDKKITILLVVNSLLLFFAVYGAVLNFDLSSIVEMIRRFL